MADGDIKALQGQIDSLKAELALRLESTEKLFNSKNESANNRITTFITYFIIALTFFGSIIVALVFFADKFGKPIITKWAEDNVAKFAEEKFQSKMVVFQNNLDAKLEDFGAKLDFNEWYKQGELEYENREFAGAVKSFTHAIKKKPNHVYANGVRGMAYYRLRKYKKAIDDLTKAIAIKPNYAQAYAYRGFSHYFLEEYVTAFNDLIQASDMSIKSGAYNNALETISFMSLNLENAKFDEKTKKSIENGMEQLEKQWNEALPKGFIIKELTPKGTVPKWF